MQIEFSVAVGTLALFLAVALLSFRIKFHGRHPALALARRWAATSNYTSVSVLLVLTAVSASCFALFAESKNNPGRSSIEIAGRNAQLNTTSADENSSVADDAAALDALRSYADNLEGNTQSKPAEPRPESTALPDVDTMIAKLAARLEKQPDDVNGWKMLGWSYFNMGMLTEAISAYEAARKLTPLDPQIQKALDQIKTAQVTAK